MFKVKAENIARRENILKFIEENKNPTTFEINLGLSICYTVLLHDLKLLKKQNKVKSFYNKEKRTSIYGISPLSWFTESK